ncbi:hypothetical protein C0Q70_11398 [Pomacea canaliculata]|uniref:Anoctamin n=1 Tax=Pomacea canaliculata TaxID=400727 RepID=A0A2T7P5Y3_POMCA|nr:hypothetical protein C0Q70_11398 [Pomacea canaliculata]
MADHDDVHLKRFSYAAAVDADGVEERHSVNHESDEDADGQATDPSRTKPKDLDSQTRNMYFDDKARKIDFILAWSIKPNKKSIEAQRARELFENNLKQEGLELEYDKKGDEIHYAKIHAPYEVLRRYADILKLRLPMKQKLASQHGKKFEDLQSPVQAVSTRLWGAAGRFFKRLMRPFEVDREKVPPIKRTYTCPYSSDKEYLFEIPEDKESLFTNACRSWIVDFILRRKSFSEDKQKAYSFGVKKMISDGYYTAAFPLHEGHWKPGSADNERKLLFDHWAWWKNCFKFQPLDYVRHYYGEKIGLYFAWLGFYTAMLVPASFVGLVVFFYGLAIRYTNVASKELCDTNVNITMCPLCDTQCPYWFLHEACSHAAASRIFDNGATVFFAIFMSLWGTLFLEFWKRNEATIQYKWDLTNFVSEEEPPRPEYLSKLEDWNTMKVNPVTGAAVAIVSVVGVIAYRVSMLAALQLIPDVIVTANSSNIKALTVDLVYQNASLVTTVTAALINLVIIIVLNFVYGYLRILAHRLGMSSYSEFVGRPGRYNTIFGARQEECEAGGCLIELCIQLAIIMVGKQLIQNNLIEIGLPKLIKLLKRKCSKETREQKLAHTPWEKDYKLEPAANTSLFYEYLEMVLQFGFLTIFCAAFPLAPLFALLNNIIEIRVDASKFITQLRRPIAERAATIGIWYSVLYGISRIAIISNAFIIALTSDFIPRLVYEMRYSPDQSLSGYVNFSLAIFNTSDFERNHQPAPALRGDIQVCRYRDFRNPPWHENKYEYSDEQIRREAYITSEIVLRTELNRARGEDVIVNSQNGSGDGSGYNSARYSPHNSEDMDRKIRHRQKADDRGDEKSYV